MGRAWDRNWPNFCNFLEITYIREDRYAISIILIIIKSEHGYFFRPDGVMPIYEDYYDDGGGADDDGGYDDGVADILG